MHVSSSTETSRRPLKRQHATLLIIGVLPRKHTKNHEIFMSMAWLFNLFSGYGRVSSRYLNLFPEFVDLT